MPNEEYLDLTGLNRFLNKIREKDLKNRARNYVINPSETLSSEYLNSSFKNTDDMSVALCKSSNGTDFKLKDVDGNDILIKDLKLGDLVSIKQISDYYPERFVGLIDTNFVHFYAYTCLAFNHIVQGSMKPVTSGAVYNALLPFNKVSTTTTTTANVIDVPTSAKGLATLKQIGGMSYKCSNLWNEEWEVGGLDINTGAKSPNSCIRSKDYISVNPSTNYFMNYNAIICFYDSNKNYITYADVNYVSFTTPSNAQYILFRLSTDYGTTYKNDVMLNLGSTALPYEAYYEGIHDSAVTKVECVGANIWDEEWENGTYSTATGNYDGNATDRICSKNKIKVIQNTTYYIKLSSGSTRIFYYDNNNNFLGTSSLITNETFITPNGCGYINFSPTNTYGTTYHHDICINKSNSAINGNYYHYKTYELPILQDIRSITGYGWGVNENCYNELDLANKKFIQRVGRVKAKDINWVYSTGNQYFNIPHFEGTINDIKIGSTNILICEYLTKPQRNDLLTTDKAISIWNATSNYLVVRDDNYNNETDFKNHFTDDDYLYYELATLVITDISSLLDEVHIPIEANGTLELANTYNNAVPVQVTFDNGLVDVVLTNHNHDIEQQKDIDFLLRGGNLKTINGQSLVGSGNISISADISHRYNIGLYDRSYIPIFIAFLTDAEQESYGPTPAKSEAINWIKTHWENEPNSNIWYVTDVTNDAGYYASGTITQAYEGLIGVVYDESQGSGSETITAYFADGTTQQIALSDIGDTDQDNYFFRVF